MFIPKAQEEKLANEGEWYFTDGKSVFWNGLYANDIIKKADIDTFVSFYYFAKDKNYCYMMGTRLKNANVDCFKVLNFSFAIDDKYVYTSVGKVPNADINTFMVLDSGVSEVKSPFGYAKDKNNVYFHNGD